MKKYKTFFIKTLIIFIISIIIIPTALIFWIDFMVGRHKYSQTASYMNYLITQKNAKAAEYDKTGNKIVILSGSNTLYGFNSKYIHDKYNLPVLNYGLHAGFEHYIFYEAQKILKSGDTVILPLEYGLYKEDSRSVPAQLAEYLVSYGKDYIKTNLTPVQKLGLSFYLVKLIIKNHSLDAQQLSEKILSQTNDFGDFTDNKGYVQDKQNIKKHIKITQNIPVSNKNFTLFKFIEFCKQNNIKLYATTPLTYHSKSFTDKEIKDFELIKDFYNKNGIEFLGTYTSGAFYDENFIYDFGYHANDKGQMLRSEKLAEFIQFTIKHK